MSYCSSITGIALLSIGLLTTESMASEPMRSIHLPNSHENTDSLAFEYLKSVDDARCIAVDSVGNCLATSGEIREASSILNILAKKGSEGGLFEKTVSTIALIRYIGAIARTKGFDTLPSDINDQVEMETSCYADRWLQRVCSNLIEIYRKNYDRRYAPYRSFVFDLVHSTDAVFLDSAFRRLVASNGPKRDISIRFSRVAEERLSSDLYPCLDSAYHGIYYCRRSTVPAIMWKEDSTLYLDGTSFENARSDLLGQVLRDSGYVTREDVQRYIRETNYRVKMPDTAFLKLWVNPARCGVDSSWSPFDTSLQRFVDITWFQLPDRLYKTLQNRHCDTVGRYSFPDEVYGSVYIEIDRIAPCHKNYGDGYVMDMLYQDSTSVVFRHKVLAGVGRFLREWAIARQYWRTYQSLLPPPKFEEVEDAIHKGVIDSAFVWDISGRYHGNTFWMDPEDSSRTTQRWDAQTEERIRSAFGAQFNTRKSEDEVIAWGRGIKLDAQLSALIGGFKLRIEGL